MNTDTTQPQHINLYKFEINRLDADFDRSWETFFKKIIYLADNSVFKKFTH